MCPLCSPPTSAPVSTHRLHDVLVADGRPHEPDAVIPKGDFEADIAHHGRDDRVAGETALALVREAEHQQHRVAVDEPAAMVDEDRPVAVPVESDAHAAPLADNRARQAAPDESNRSRG